MRRKEYKIRQFRPKRPIALSSEDLELFINEYCEKGWVVRSIIFHSDIITYEIMFERECEVKK